MKVHEYRIGNIVMGNKPFALKANDIALAYNHEKFKGEPRWNDVPLTEEWLLKFGFKRVKGWDDMHFWIIPDERNNSDRFELLETGKGYEMNSGSICPYVHTLQNCYYFHYLTGQELTITE